jgi:hypothetical protein
MKNLNEKWEDAGHPLTMEKEILKIRVEIENNKRHKEENKTLTTAAFNEIRSHQGKLPVTLSCGSCTDQANRLLIKWLTKYDERTKSQQEKSKRFKQKKDGKILPDEAINSAEDNGTLIPVDDRRAVLSEMSYWSLVKEFEKLAEDEKAKVYKSMTGKKPKKTEIVEALLKN